MRRRDLLAGGLAASAAMLLPGRAHAAWGTAPQASQPLILADGVRAQRVLEVFLYGGLSPWESFYAVPEHGAPGSAHPGQQWNLFASSHASTFNACGVPPSEHLVAWASDSAGRMVHLGPGVAPLRDRPDVLARTRVVVMRHDLEPHEAAIPLALSGMRLGSPRMVGMGGHLQRFWSERAPRIEPYAYVLQPNNIYETDNTRAADAIGLHPGSARPLALRITDDQAFLDRLGRNRLQGRAQQWDALNAFYGARMRQRYQAGGQPLRSSALSDHESARSSIQNAPAIQDVLGPDFMSPRTGSRCGQSALSYTAMGLEAATQLLTHPATPARYVNVVDTGLLLADGGGGYDTHSDHLRPQVRNASHTLQQLMERINEPGEGDPDKLDLDDTMIVLTTEFGRTPWRQDGGNGTNHHPGGYVCVLIGGPVGPDQAGVAGAIGEDGFATDYTTPSELRAALLAACGMYPFAHESFAVGDVRGVPTERDALALLQERVLGRPA